MSKVSILPHLCHMCPVWSTLQSLRETRTPGCYSPIQGNLGAWLLKCRFAGDESPHLCNCLYFGFIFEGSFCWLWSWLQNSGLKGLSYSSLRKSFYWILPVNLLQGIGCLPQFWSFVAALKIFDFLLVLRNLRITPLGLFPSCLLAWLFWAPWTCGLFPSTLDTFQPWLLQTSFLLSLCFCPLRFQQQACNTAWSYYTDHGYSCFRIIFLSLYFLLVGPPCICPLPCLFCDVWYYCTNINILYPHICTYNYNTSKCVFTSHISLQP